MSLQSLHALCGASILATDGEIGKVHDFFIDDQDWRVRYLVVRTGAWMTGKHVLITPPNVKPEDWTPHHIPVALSKAEILACPDADFDRPVSRQQEMAIADQYGWTYYWTAEPILLPGPPSAINDSTELQEAGNPHLRSLREVRQYRIHAVAGEIGHMCDLLVGTRDWKIRRFVVDTRNWIPGRKVLVDPAWTTSVSWSRCEVNVRVERAAIRQCPAYDASMIGSDELVETGF
jgi:hypothetical protein